MLRLPPAFLHGEILQARRVRGLILARARYSPGLRRLEFACGEVCFSEAPLSDVALAAGFCDQSHFSRAFKRHTGFSPAEYRAAARRRS
jgi:transcriptional regulator GlxA family with amidase domain